MSNKRITDLTELTTPTTDDVFPVVDIASNTTTKVQLGNLPVPTAVTTALATKQDTLVSGTNIKTVNSTSLVGSGNVAVQETLVSGTNIKTLNSTSLLGSGNIVLTANPSGVSGAIQFSNGSAFASDAANLFWDDTNNRFGVGTNAPTATGHFRGAGITSATSSLLVQNSAGTNLFNITDDSRATLGQLGTGNNGALLFPFPVVGTNGVFWGESFVVGSGCLGSITLSRASGEMRILAGSGGYFQTIYSNNVEAMRIDTSQNVNIGATALGARVGIKGSGSTSATTSLLVQNSAGSEMLKLTDAGSLSVSKIITSVVELNYVNSVGGAFSIMQGNNANGNARFYQFVSVGKSTDPVASAALEVESNAKGFLPPRMTTTQKNAIATPAAGLVVYDSTTNKLCCYNGSTWNDLF